ncbi:MAG: PHP domain-containing protein [Candidatus Woesearchaeota archaeon]
MDNPIDGRKIIFEKPDPRKLFDQGFMCIDMHLHSKCSDGSASVNAIMKKAKKNSFGIALTDHNEIKGSLNAYSNACQRSPVIPAIEVNSSSGPDVLLYFYETSHLEDYFRNYIKNNRSLDPNGKTSVSFYDIIDSARKYDCLVVGAHPAGVAYKNIFKLVKKENTYEYLKKLHGLEIMNGEMSRKVNKNAIVWNYNLGICYTGGSDAHTLKEVGHVLTCARADNYQEFLDKIKKQKNFVIGKELQVRRKPVVYTSIFRKHAPYFHPRIIERIGNGFKKKPDVVIDEMEYVPEKELKEYDD